MTIPNVPANLASGDAVTEAWVDDVVELFAHLRDDRAILAVEGGGVNVTTATQTVIDLASETPRINNGGWVAGASSGWDAPEDGIYEVVGMAAWAADSASGSREVLIKVNGSEIDSGNSGIGRLPGVGSTSRSTAHFAVDVVDLTAGDELTVTLYQTSGGNVFGRAQLIAKLLVAT